MSRSHVVMLFARCGRTLWPAASSAVARRGVVHSRLTSPLILRSYSDQADPSKRTDDPIEFPKPPLSPLKHFFHCARSFRDFSAGAFSLQVDADSVEQLHSATKEVLTYVTERLAAGDFKAVENRFTPACCEETRSMVSSLSDEDREFLFYDALRSSIIDHIYPWGCREIYFDNRQVIEITYCALQVLLNGTQIVWGISVLMPEHGGSSEEWTINRLHFDIVKPS